MYINIREKTYNTVYSFTSIAYFDQSFNVFSYKTIILLYVFYPYYLRTNLTTYPHIFLNNI